MRKLKNPKAIGYCLKCGVEFERPSDDCKCPKVELIAEPETFNDWFAESSFLERCPHCGGRHQTRGAANSCRIAYAAVRKAIA